MEELLKQSHLPFTSHSAQTSRIHRKFAASSSTEKQHPSSATVRFTPKPTVHILEVWWNVIIYYVQCFPHIEMNRVQHPI